MKLKMLFGTIVSAGLAYAVLTLFGFYQGAITPFQVVTGVLLAGAYLIAFRAAVVGKEARVKESVQQVMTWEDMPADEKQVLATAA